MRPNLWVLIYFLCCCCYRLSSLTFWLRIFIVSLWTLLFLRALILTLWDFHTIIIATFSDSVDFLFTKYFRVTCRFELLIYFKEGFLLIFTQFHFLFSLFSFINSDFIIYGFLLLLTLVKRLLLFFLRWIYFYMGKSFNWLFFSLLFFDDQNLVCIFTLEFAMLRFLWDNLLMNLFLLNFRWLRKD